MLRVFLSRIKDKENIESTNYNPEIDRGYICLLNHGNNEKILIGREGYNLLFK
jgi:hypothetical protein